MVTAAPTAAATPVLLSTTPRNWTYKELIIELLQLEDCLVYWIRGLLASTCDCIKCASSCRIAIKKGVAVSSQRMSGCTWPAFVKTASSASQNSCVDDSLMGTGCLVGSKEDQTHLLCLLYLKISTYNTVCLTSYLLGITSNCLRNYYSSLINLTCDTWIASDISCGKDGRTSANQVGPWGTTFQ